MDPNNNNENQVPQNLLKEDTQDRREFAEADCSGVGVTLVRVSREGDSRTFIVTTYNGPKKEYEGCIRLSDIRRQLPIWKFVTGIYDPKNKKDLDALPFYRSNWEGRRTAREFDYLIKPPEDGWDSTQTYLLVYKLDGIVGLCLSGGGYRALVLHLGSIRRLFELELLLTVDTLTSVSGGAILAALLATVWDGLTTLLEKKKAYELANKYFDNLAENERLPKYKDLVFEILVLLPARQFAAQNVALNFLLQPADQLVTELEKAEETAKKNALELVKNKYGMDFPEITHYLTTYGFSQTLKTVLPDGKKENTPNFIFCGTDISTGDPFYFSKNWCGHTIPSKFRNFKRNTDFDPSESESKEKLPSKIKLSQAVAASAAFPVFGPLIIPYKTSQGVCLEARVADGGIYDNLGLDPIWVPNPEEKAPGDDRLPHHFVFISDGGAPLHFENNGGLLTNLKRDSNIIMKQLERKRMGGLKEIFENYPLRGAVWSLNDLSDYFHQVRLSQDKELPVCYRDQVKLLLEILPKEENFPNLRRLLGDEADIDKIIKCITKVRTDMDQFYPEEEEIMEMVGYLLAAIRIRLFCGDYKLRTMQDEEINLHQPFRMDPMYAKYIGSEVKDVSKIICEKLKYSDNLWEVHSRHIGKLRSAKMFLKAAWSLTKYGGHGLSKKILDTQNKDLLLVGAQDM